MLNTLVTSALIVSLLTAPVNKPVVSVAGQLVESPRVLSSESLDLANRYPVQNISEGFKENILIALSYLATKGQAFRGYDGFYLVLEPGEVFAFHKKGILPEFQKDKIITQESDFTTNTGYKVVAGLGGNGVCHLASLINLTAKKAGLEVVSLVDHDYAKIPGINREYGTSISTRNGPERQNLYIKNNYDFAVQFRFFLSGDNLSLTILPVVGADSRI